MKVNAWHDLDRSCGAHVCWNAAPYPGEAPDGPDGTPLLLPVQTHSLNIAFADENCASFPDTDALITRRKGVYVGVRTADCVPVLLHAPDIGAVAAVHAGWRGALGKLPLLTALRMKEMGAELDKMRAWIGPCICGDCYEVDAELAMRFAEAGFAGCVAFGHSKPHIDLAGASGLQLEEIGLKGSNIAFAGVCTRHSSDAGGYLCPSWRREPGTHRRLVSCIAMI